MGLELRHEFTVPATLEETWAAFNDIESVAVCFPGASVSTVDGDTFEGSCKVKLGPIALVYNGTGTFVEKNESARRMVIEANGKDKRGNGTAGAHVAATMTQAGTSTRVVVLTDLRITGKPAQFGRGVMQDVSDKLLGQFTACLEKKVGDSSAAAHPAASDSDLSLGTSPSSPDPSPEPSSVSAVRGEVAAPQSNPSRRDAEQVWSDGNVRAPVPPREVIPLRNDEALDLGATVLPVIAKAYWKQALAVALGLLALRRLLHRD